MLSSRPTLRSRAPGSPRPENAGTAARQTRAGSARGRCRHTSESPTPSTLLSSLPGRPVPRGSCGSPIRGSPGPPEDQGLDVPPGGRAAGLGVHGPRRPAAADDVAVPVHDRVRRDQQPQPVARFRFTSSSAVGSARSAQFRFGRCDSRRCRTASWWRRIKISAAFHVSSRRDSRSHAVSRVVRLNTNAGT